MIRPLNILIASALLACGPTPPTLPDVAASAEETQPLAVGAAAPDVLLRNASGTEIRLHDLVKDQPAVLVFYRGGWCPYCSEQLQGLRDIQEPLNELGASLIAVSPDKPETFGETVSELKLGYQVVSDSSMDAARGFGIAFQVDGTTLIKYRTFGIDLNEASGFDHNVLPVPSVFVVGTDATIAYVHSDPDYRVRPNPQDILAATREALTH